MEVKVETQVQLEVDMRVIHRATLWGIEFMTLFTVSAGNDAITVLIRFSKALVFNISFSCTFLSTMDQRFSKGFKSG